MASHPPGDQLRGSSGNDAITGSSIDDIIRGGAGNDNLMGLAGDDYLYGGTSADQLIGSTGNDIYLVDNAGDQVIEDRGEGYDLVYTYISFKLAAGQEIEVLSTHTHSGPMGLTSLVTVLPTHSTAITALMS